MEESVYQRTVCGTPSPPSKAALDRVFGFSNQHSVSKGVAFDLIGECSNGSLNLSQMRL